MKLPRCARLLCAAAAALLSQPPYAYEANTHRDLSAAAADGSILNDPNVVARLGLRFPIGSDRQKFPNSRGDFASVRSLIIDGAEFEDLPAIRALNHFYDPTTDSGLLLTSPYWAIDDGLIPAPFQSYSLRRAHGYQFQSLTNPSASERSRNSGLLYETVGHVIHHVQDMAQPQHVRMDAHLTIADTLQQWGLPDGELFFEHHSRYEIYTEGNRKSLSGLMTATSSPPLFSKGRDYWKNDAKTGIAEYTNRNFVSSGTNFLLEGGQVSANDRYPDPKPSATPTEIQPIAALFAAKGQPVPAQVAATCPGATDCNVLFFGSPVSTRASSLSIFDEDLTVSSRQVTYVNPDTGTAYQVDRLFALNDFNFDAAHHLLIPKATDYSAGLINFIFRGQMEITPPDENVYSVVDHSTIHQTDALHGFVGFDTVKLKLRNATPNGEAMSGGTLVAVAKFHRNGCYKDDLSGEWTESGGLLIPPCGLFRTEDEEIVVSTSVQDAAGNVLQTVSLDPTAPQQYKFTFGTPIPINATDLFLQVVYRGALGSESDAVVVATKDIFEPTYMSIFNSTDEILFFGTFFPTTSPALLPTLDPNHTGTIASSYDKTDLAILFNFNSSFTGSPLGSVAALPPGRFSRVALLTDRSPFSMPIEADEKGFFFASSLVSEPAETDQLNFDPTIDDFVQSVSVFSALRGINNWGSLTFYRSFPAPTAADLSTLPPISNTAPYPLTTLNFK